MRFNIVAHLCILANIVSWIHLVAAAPRAPTSTVGLSALSERKVSHLGNSGSDSNWWSRIGGLLGLEGIEAGPPTGRDGVVDVFQPYPANDTVAEGVPVSFPEDDVSDVVADHSLHSLEERKMIVTRRPSLSADSGSGITIYEELQPTAGTQGSIDEAVYSENQPRRLHFKIPGAFMWGAGAPTEGMRPQS